MEYHEVLTTIEQYLQQQSLFGSTLYRDVGAPEQSHNVTQAAQTVVPPAQHIEQDKSAIFMETIPETLTPILQGNRVQTTKSDWKQTSSLALLRESICTCQKCPLGATRTKFVFGVGNPNADIMVIGEAPGADEDAQGEPFVGRAGQLLTKILEAIELRREDVFIANILKCRPPNNRRPEPAEVEQCEPYLHKQMELIQPKFILALGLTAVTSLLKIQCKMGDIRGKLLSFYGVPMIATYHPAALLRNPEWKKATWEDVKLLRRLYDESRGIQSLF